MSTNQPPVILLPPGRIVQGNLYDGDATDMDGKPAFYPVGHKNAGQPKVSFFFAVAIPKTPGVAHWASTEWGAPIWAFGHAAWPNGQAQAPTFAWKIEDGDSTVPNRKGNKNVDRPGHAGNWIVKMSSSYAPRIYVKDSSGRMQEFLAKDAAQPGDWVQVQVSIDTNKRDSNPGIYVNHSMVSYLGQDAVNGRIRIGADPNSVAWAAAPVGVQLAPVGSTSAPVTAAPPAPGAAPPPPGSAAAPPPPAPAAAPAAPPPPQTAVAPAPGFTAPPAPPAPGAAPPAPPAPVGPQMTAKAAGQTYAAFIAKGWNDQQLRDNGYMT
jgi:hypothetical protein